MMCRPAEADTVPGALTPSDARTKGPFDMTSPTSGVPYVLGDTGAEHGRLIRQAAIFNPFTERLFRDAGIGPGQRVLEIGSGVGDVAMLAARLVGPSGEVVGVERDVNTLAKARSRVAEARLPNVSFMESDVGHVVSSEPFDAVVGRLILEFLPEPGAVVRSLSSRGHHCLPGLLLGSAAPVDGASSPKGEVCITHSPDLPAFRGEHGYGAPSLPGISGGGLARAQNADRGPGWRRPGDRTMGL
jgi:SAM-dependent methyltransferase